MEKEKADTAVVLIEKNKLLSKLELEILKGAIENQKDLAFSILDEESGTGFDLAITIVDLKGKGLELCPFWLHPEKERIARGEVADA